MWKLSDRITSYPGTEQMLQQLSARIVKKKTARMEILNLNLILLSITFNLSIFTFPPQFTMIHFFVSIVAPSNVKMPLYVKRLLTVKIDARCEK